MGQIKNKIKFDGKQYSLQGNSIDKKPEATKQAEKLRKKGSLVRTVRIDNRYYLYTRKRVLKPSGDFDKDGVKNSKDCKPFNPKKHGVPKKEELYRLALQKKARIAKQERRIPIQPTPKYGVQPTPTKEKLYRLALQKKSGIIGRPIQPTIKSDAKGRPRVLTKELTSTSMCTIGLIGYGKVKLPAHIVKYMPAHSDLSFGRDIEFYKKHKRWPKYYKIYNVANPGSDYRVYREGASQKRIGIKKYMTEVDAGLRERGLFKRIKWGEWDYIPGKLI